MALCSLAVVMLSVFIHIIYQSNIYPATKLPTTDSNQATISADDVRVFVYKSRPCARQISDRDGNTDRAAHQRS